MTSEFILNLADPQATLDSVGGKGVSLARLARAGLPVPNGFHITTAVYRRFVEKNKLWPRIQTALTETDIRQPAALETASRCIERLFMNAEIPVEISAAIASAYTSLLGPHSPAAIRSSATSEDLPELSFAGQQETFLNIQGVDAILSAVKRCWASLWTARAISYRIHNHIDHETASLAIVVQELVPAESAGILFTANPLNGRRDQIVISAAWGLGEAIVGGLVTPDHLVIDKSSGKILEQQIAAKQVMTVRTSGATTTQAVPVNMRNAPVLDANKASELARIGAQIENLYGMPMDIEWAISAGKIAILQARPVTTLAKAQTEPAGETRWAGPKRGIRYLRNNIVELMPDPLTPLFNTLGRRIINKALRLAVDHFVGRSLMPEEPIITINGYAYYNGDFNKSQIWFLLANSAGVMRRMFTGMEERWQEARPRYAGVVDRWRSSPINQLPSSKILEGASEIVEAAIDYYVAIVSGLIPAAWMSEGLFTAVYNLLVKQRTDPKAPVFLLGFDSAPIRSEKALFDLAEWVRTNHPDLAACLASVPTNRLLRQIEENTVPDEQDYNAWQAWQEKFRSYLDQYGAAIYDLDFAKPTPAEHPEPIVETLKLFLKGLGTNPYERQQASTRRREEAVSAIRKRLKGFRLALFDKYLARAQHLAPLREDGLAGLGYGYPCLRRLLLELGKRLTQANAIGQADDVFWMEESELINAAAALDAGETIIPYRNEVQKRKAEWKNQKRLTPPFALPQRMKPRITVWRGNTKSSSSILKGIPCSPGRVTGTARVLSGPEDFALMQPGEVLIAAITTPAWTPLFAMASAIVTDVGGPLSHGSIVAREYRIPAVLGTGVATARITSGQLIEVDGDLGRVRILDN